jgi:hypothetical protein
LIHKPDNLEPKSARKRLQIELIYIDVSETFPTIEPQTSLTAPGNL